MTTIIEALQNARDFLEALGIKSGDIHDELHLAICQLLNRHAKVCLEELPEVQ